METYLVQTCSVVISAEDAAEERSRGPQTGTAAEEHRPGAQEPATSGLKDETF